jgi:metallophosphoesterase (TIGR00282 family)
MSETINILFSGDVVGEPGREAIQKLLPGLKEKYQIDFCVVNGENSAGGAGITPKTYKEIRDAGADVVTSGDHVWDNKEVMSIIATEPRLLRPSNFPAKALGTGTAIFETSKGIKVGVLNMMGRTYMKNLDCPFQTSEREVEKIRKETPIIFVDMHAETTSEKIALGRFLDGKVSAVVGTHTHVQTADEQIFPNGTAFLCDAGMTGPHESILGREIEPIIQRFITHMPQKFPVAQKDIRLNGVVVKVNVQTGKALEIKRLTVPLVP